MLYLVKDKHGFTMYVLKVKGTQITPFGMADAVRNFLIINKVETSIDFDVVSFIKMLKKNGIKAKLCKFDVANLKV